MHPPTARPPLQLASVSDLPRRYAAILLDQFGCLHDGREALPGTIAAVAALASTGARLVILSNSSRRADGALDRLGRLGFERACFAGAVTSGEVAHTTLAQPGHGYGRRCLHITWAARGGVSLEGLDLTVCGEEDVDSVDFILVHGTEGVGAAGEGDDSARPGPTPRSLDELKALLQRAAAARSPHPPPPLLCANPDLVTVDGGALVTMPGTLAAWYEAAGGPVVRLGKPAAPIYAAALAALGSGLRAADVLAVGDSLEHDIAGAAAAGMDSLFIGSGIDGGALGLPSGAGEAVAYLGARPAPRAAPTVDPALLEKLLKGRPPGQVPTFVMDYLMV